jgi:hypothetical protein
MRERVLVQVEGADAADTAEITGSLCEEIMELDVENVEPGDAKELPAAAKGDASEIGALLVTLMESAVAPVLVQVVCNWVSRRRDTKVTLVMYGRRLEIDSAQQQNLDAAIENFLRELDQ